MGYYHGFGLDLLSDIDLPGFIVAPAGIPDVRIERAPVPLDRWNELNDDGMGLLGVAEGVMRFLVEDGERIIVEPLEGADMEYVKAIVSGELMSALLRQRGLLVLHASCVAREGEAVGFVGHSGWGKSTLASHFVHEEYRLLADDVLAIRFEGGEAFAVPAYPQVKLRQDSGALYVDGFEALSEAHAETDKRLVSFQRSFQEEPTRLAGLYVLESESRPVSGVVPLPAQQAFVELTRHTRATNLIKKPEFVSAHLAQVTRLLSVVPVRLLRRKRSLDLLPDLYDLVRQDLQLDYVPGGVGFTRHPST